MCRKKYFTELKDLSGNSAFPVASWTCLNILTQGKTNFFHRPAFQIKGSVVFDFLGRMKRVPNSGLEFRESFEFPQKFFLNFGAGILGSRLGLGNESIHQRIENTPDRQFDVSPAFQALFSAGKGCFLFWYSTFSASNT